MNATATAQVMTVFETQGHTGGGTGFHSGTTWQRDNAWGQSHPIYRRLRYVGPGRTMPVFGHDIINAVETTDQGLTRIIRSWTTTEAMTDAGSERSAWQIES